MLYDENWRKLQWGKIGVYYDYAAIWVPSDDTTNATLIKMSFSA